MAKHGKKYRAVREKAEDKVYELEEALTFLKANKTSKFDETAELAFRLGVDPKKTEQTVRGTVSLPHGTGKTKRVLVFATGDAAAAARDAGADFVGHEDLIEKIKGGWLDFDVAVATPEAMKQVRTLGKMLGPRGLMPNPKTETVTEDVGQAVRQLKGGRIEYRMDRHGNLQVGFGKISFDAKRLAENAQVIIDAVRAGRPAAAKGVFIKRCTVSSTMGVGLRVNVKD